MADCIPFFAPGTTITGLATAAVTGGRCVKISGNITDGPLLAATALGTNLKIAHADAQGRIFGVAARDAATGQRTSVYRHGYVVPVTATGAIAAFAEVEVGVNGTVQTKNTGVAVGVCLTAAADGADAMIALY